MLPKRVKPLAALALSYFLILAPLGAQSPAGVTTPRSASQPPDKALPESAPPRPDKRRAEKAFEQGRQAEQSGDWKQAYAEYSDAATYAPADQEYSANKEHARFQWVQQLTDLAERQLVAGDDAGARGQLFHALEVDPTYQVARERLGELPPVSSGGAEQQSPRLAGLPRLTLRPGVRDFDYSGATRGAYAELAQQFGITAVFDGELADRPVRFRVSQLDFETALLVLGRQTHTFARVVDAHTIFIAEDTAAKKRDYELEVESSLVFPNAIAADEMNEVVRAVREVAGITRTQLDTASRTLTLRGTEQNVALAHALMDQLEQPHGEMMLEVEILEVNRNAAHQLGVTPPSSATTFTLSQSEIRQLQQAENNGTLLQVIQSIFGGSGLLGTPGGSSSMIPPVIAFGGGKTLFLATLPGATANFAQTLSVVRDAKRVLLRAQDGKLASFFVGDRFPISLALLSSNLATQSTAFSPGTLPGVFPRQDFTVGNAPVGVAVADFNGDGHPDLVVANSASSIVARKTAGTISILLGVGDGTFGAQTQIDIGAGASPPAVLPVPSAVAVGDFNGDGIQDIAVTDSANNNVAILLGNGDGTFTAPVRFSTGTNPVALLTTDLNGDGALDLAVVNQGSGTTPGSVSILLGQIDTTTGKPNGTFGAKTDYTVGTKPTAIASADFNGDGLPDLAVANFGGSGGSGGNSVSVLLQKTDHTFTASANSPFATGNGPQGVTTGDFNHDGREDLAVSNQTDGTVSVLLGNGDGTFGAHTDFAAGNGPAGIAAAALNGANLDLVVADQTGNDLSVLLGNTDGTFTAPISIPTGNGPVAVAAADFNGDGLVDVVSANDETPGSVTVTLNTTQFPSSSSSSFGQSSFPASEYVDLGLTLKATPRLHGDDEVTLQLQFDIRSLAGQAINGIPILTNRTIEQTVRLRQNQTSVLSGILSSSDLRSLSGWPGSATLSGVGYLTGNQNRQTQDTELLILITPRALRLPPRNERTLFAGYGEPANAPAAAPPIAPPPLPPGVLPGQPAPPAGVPPQPPQAPVSPTQPPQPPISPTQPPPPPPAPAQPGTPPPPTPPVPLPGLPQR